MNTIFSLIVDAAIVVALFLGFAQFRSPRYAKRGNLTATFALLAAVGIVLIRSGVEHHLVVGIALLIGAVIGWIMAMRVTMIQIPAMVAFQHGAGGIAAMFISFVELWMGGSEGIELIAKVSGFLGLIIGAATFSASMIASGKLIGYLKSHTTKLSSHGLIMCLIVVSLGAISFFAMDAGVVQMVVSAIFLAVLSMLLGVLLAIRIGGADMPVLISFLNATAGIAAAFCGVIVGNRLLIASGAMVAASGSILTHVMCKAMNRSVLNVFWSSSSKGATSSGATAAKAQTPKADLGVDPLTRATGVFKSARSVVIIPGYGMAVGQAQFKVNELAQVLEKAGKDVRFAIHPVAGRMPGHMNVLLAEAGVSYDKLFEMDDVNPLFPETDVAIVIGACDVVNPAAIDKPDTPISGMPILNAHQAKNVIVCNLDERPGYSGVPNTLYEQGNAILLFGNALETVGRIIEGVATNPA